MLLLVAAPRPSIGVDFTVRVTAPPGLRVVLNDSPDVQVDSRTLNPPSLPGLAIGRTLRMKFCLPCVGLAMVAWVPALLPLSEGRKKSFPVVPRLPVPITPYALPLGFCPVVPVSPASYSPSNIRAIAHPSRSSRRVIAISNSGSTGKIFPLELLHRRDRAEIVSTVDSPPPRYPRRAVSDGLARVRLPSNGFRWPCLYLRERLSM